MNHANYTVEIDYFKNEWKILYKEKSIGQFTDRKDEKERTWLFDGFVEEIHQKQGLGCMMIKKAVEYYDAVYFSTATRTEHNNHSKSYDSRYLLEEGTALMESCIRQKIIKEEWCINPWQQ